MLKRHNFLVLGSISLILPVFLSGCDTVRSTLGLDHYQADAFNVPTNPPLTLPPEYTLRPPTPGAAPSFTQTSNAQAQQTLNTYNAQAYSDNKSEGGLMNKVASTSTPPSNIRELVDKEANEESDLGGKLGKQVDDWKTQAKKNIMGISDESKNAQKMEEKPKNSPSDMVDKGPS